MKYISSQTNPLFKRLNRLNASARARRTEQKTIIDGVHLVEEWLRHDLNDVMVCISEDALDHPEVRTIQDNIREVVIFSRPLFDILSPVAHGVGILGIVDIPPAKSAAQFSLADDALWIDGVQDNGNIGTMLRTAAAAGVRQVIMSHAADTAWSPKCLRAAMGAHLSIDFFEAAAVTSALSDHPNIIATSGQAEYTLFETDLTPPTVWIMGNEGAGVSVQTAALATRAIKIPMNSQIESLNVATASAICLFEQMRQRRYAASRNM